MATTGATTGTTNSVVQDLMQSTAQKKSISEAQADQFMTLLTTQMRYQDPLNPMDNAQMTSQLAQINTVKGIEQLNTAIQSLVNQSTSNMTMQAAALIGKNVLAPGNTLTLSSEGAAAGLELAGSADRVTVVIKNGAGVEVAREDLGAQKSGPVAFTWDGKATDGTQLPVGNYSFSVTAKSGSTDVKASTLGVGTVNALVKGTNGFQLDVAGLGRIEFDTVRQVF